MHWGETYVAAHISVIPVGESRMSNPRATADETRGLRRTRSFSWSPAP
jgi:hypothetical protein